MIKISDLATVLGQILKSTPPSTAPLARSSTSDDPRRAFSRSSRSIPRTSTAIPSYSIISLWASMNLYRVWTYFFVTHLDIESLEGEYLDDRIHHRLRYMPRESDLIVEQLACEQAAIITVIELRTHMPGYIHPACGILSRVHLYHGSRASLEFNVGGHRQAGIFQDSGHPRSDSLPFRKLDPVGSLKLFHRRILPEGSPPSCSGDHAGQQLVRSPAQISIIAPRHRPGEVRTRCKVRNRRVPQADAEVSFG